MNRLVPKLPVPNLQLKETWFDPLSIPSARRAAFLPKEKRLPTSRPHHRTAGDDDDDENTVEEAVNRVKMPPRDYDRACPQSRLVDLGVPFKGIEDMIGIDRLNEESILLNLQRRYEDDQIYTYTGSILVSVNPYRNMPIYTMKYVKEYMGKPLGSLAPHIYATANAAYAALADKKKNQSIIISGESGAGKTEATKLIMQFLAQCTNKHSEVEQKILEANPVLEAFGNAATVRNNNSSRFGRFVEIRFSETRTSIEGARITNYLLEKSRIVKQAKGERNYHAFYMLLAGCTEAEKKKYFLKEAKDYHYLNQSDVYTLPNVDDKHDWERMKIAMMRLGIADYNQHSVFCILAGILNLGNIEFTSGAKGKTMIADQSLLDTTSTLLGVQPDALSNALLTRLIVAGSEKMVKLLTPQEAMDARDTLAKVLYDRLFGWLVNQVNNCIRGTFSESCPFIGILDIFGFENFAENSFEQLCINFTNEALQQHFNHHIFMLEQKEYQSQGLNWESITFNDNQKCLELIEGVSPPGILQLLDEEARFPKGTDDSFLEKVTNNHKKNAHFSTPPRRSPSFIIKHYAGDVVYQAPGFLEKNRDPLGAVIISCFQSSSIVLLRKLFPEDLTTPRTLRGGPKTIGVSFRMQLRALMELLASTEPHYVRCIKPNMFKIQRCFDAALVFHQLSYAGMMETIKIRKSGYPIRETYESFWCNYRVLSTRTRFSTPPGGAYGAGCRLLIDVLVEENSGLILPEHYYIGLSKILMKDVQYSLLDNARRAVLRDYIYLLHRHMRAYHDRRLFLRKRRAATKIASVYRAYRARARYAKMKKAALKIQTWHRMRTQRRKWIATKKVTLYIQSTWKMVPDRRAYKALKKSMITIQRHYRYLAMERRREERRRLEAREREEKQAREKMEREDKEREAKAREEVERKEKEEEDRREAERLSPPAPDPIVALALPGDPTSSSQVHHHDDHSFLPPPPNDLPPPPPPPAGVASDTAEAVPPPPPRDEVSAPISVAPSVPPPTDADAVEKPRPVKAKRVAPVQPAAPSDEPWMAAKIRSLEEELKDRDKTIAHFQAEMITLRLTLTSRGIVPPRSMALEAAPPPPTLSIPPLPTADYGAASPDHEGPPPPAAAAAPSGPAPPPPPPPPATPVPAARAASGGDGAVLQGPAAAAAAAAGRRSAGPRPPPLVFPPSMAPVGAAAGPPPPPPPPPAATPTVGSFMKGRALGGRKPF